MTAPGAPGKRIDPPGQAGIEGVTGVHKDGTDGCPAEEVQHAEERPCRSRLAAAEHMELRGGIEARTEREQQKAGEVPEAAPADGEKQALGEQTGGQKPQCRVPLKRQDVDEHASAGADAMPQKHIDHHDGTERQIGIEQLAGPMPDEASKGLI